MAVLWQNMQACRALAWRLQKLQQSGDWGGGRAHPPGLLPLPLGGRHCGCGIAVAMFHSVDFGSLLEGAREGGPWDVRSPPSDVCLILVEVQYLFRPLRAPSNVLEMRTPQRPGTPNVLGPVPLWAEFS